MSLFRVLAQFKCHKKWNFQFGGFDSANQWSSFLKQSHTLFLFGHWFQAGQLANRLKQTPYWGQHNMVSREQQASWPHSDTIRKRRETYKKHVSSDGLALFYYFSNCHKNQDVCAIFLTMTERTNYNEIHVQLWNIQHFKATGAPACGLTATVTEHHICSAFAVFLLFFS